VRRAAGLPAVPGGALIVGAKNRQRSVLAELAKMERIRQSGRVPGWLSRQGENATVTLLILKLAGLVPWPWPFVFVPLVVGVLAVVWHRIWATKRER